MNKRFFLISVILVLGAALASAYSFKVDGLCYDIDCGNSVTVTYEVDSSNSYNTLVGDLHIPESVDYEGQTYKVTAIGRMAFRGCNGLTSVSIPNTVTTIESYALWGCAGLTSVTIGNSVASIGEFALSDCRLLSSIVVATDNPKYDSRDNCNAIIETSTNILIAGCKNTIIPGTVTRIGVTAFRGCSGLTSVTLPETVTAIDARAFERCSGLLSVTMGNSVTTIGNNAFGGCSSLKSLTLGNSVATIGEGAFTGCTGLTSVDFPASIATIGGYAFNGCTGLTSVDFPASITTIGGFAFNGCTGLTSLTIPRSTRKIGDSAFMGCTGLTSLIIDNAAVSFGHDVFRGCTALTTVDFGSALITLGIDVFANTPWYINQPDGLVYTGTVAYNIKGIMPDGTSVQVKEGIQGINQMCFMGRSGLTSVTLPESLTTIGELAFGSCTGLSTVTIPTSVAKIGNNAFNNCTGLTSVVWNAASCDDFPTSYNAPFSWLSGLQSFEFGDKVKMIPAYLCSGQSDLTTVTIPESVTAIGRYAFNKCTSLEHVSAYPRCEDITMGGDVFGGGTTDGCTLHVRPSCLAAYRAADGWKDFANIVGDLEDPLDINADGLINVGDANMVLVEILEHPTGDGNSLYDVNGDGLVNVGDVNVLLDTILRQDL